MEKRFSHQTLSHRSFYGQELNGAIFEDCDLRGCDFRQAQLQHAIFRRVRLGLSGQKWVGYGAIATAVTVLAFQAISHMVFGSIGTAVTPDHGGFIIALYVSLAIAGLVALPPSWRPVWCPQAFTKLPMIAAGALLGFYYGGIATNQNSQAAIFTAGVAGLVTGLMCLLRPQADGLLAIATLTGTVAAYGFSFMTIGTASAALSTGHPLPALVWGLLSLLYLGLTWNGIRISYRTLHSLATTRFHGANLTHTTFEAVLGPHPRQ